ncbi:MAG: hypothetical protein AAGH79_17920 [Bacteroidota bacterium]
MYGLNLSFWAWGLLSLWSGTPNQEPAQLELFWLDPCSGEVSPLLAYLLQKETADTIIRFYSGASNRVDLPSSGMYELSLLGFRESIPYLVNTPKQIDTLALNAVNLKIAFDIPFNTLHYYCCDTLCEGQANRYFPTGELMMQGTFKHGNPIGELIFFEISGKVRETRIYTQNEMV